MSRDVETAASVRAPAAAPSTGAPSSRTSRAANGAVVAFIQYGLQIAFQAALMPLVLRVAGQDALGVYAILAQALGLIALVDFGLSFSISRHLAHAHGLSDGGQRFRSILTTATTFGAITNGVFASLTLAAAAGLPVLVDASDEAIRGGRIGLVTLAAWALVRTPLMVRASALTAVQDLARANVAAIGGNVARISRSLALVLLGTGVAGLILGQVIGEIVGSGAKAWMFTKRHRVRGINWGFPDRALARELISFGSQAFLIDLGVRLMLQVDAIVVGNLFGAAAASVYYATQMPGLVSLNIPMKLVDNASPGVNELYARRDHDALKRTFVTMQRYAALAVVPIAVGVAAFTGPLVRRWLGPAQFGGDSLALAVAVFALSVNVAHAAGLFVAASGDIRVPSILAVAEGVANLGLSIVLGRAMGLPGVMWATVATNVPTTVYLLWRCERDLHLGWQETLAGVRRAAIPGAVAVGSALGIARWMRLGGWAELIVGTAAYCALYGIVAWTIGLTARDREQLTDGLRVRFARKPAESGSP